MSADITKPETWYGLGLGESVNFSDTFLLRRVPGGWLSVRFIRKGGFANDDQSSLNMHIVETFIPFSNEFDVCAYTPWYKDTPAFANKFLTGCGKELNYQELRINSDTLCVPSVCGYCGKKTKLDIRGAREPNV